MNRRSFLGNAIAGLAASGFLTQMRGWAQATTNANGLNLPIGFQSYVFREEISQKPQERRERGKIHSTVPDRASNDATKPKVRQECRLFRSEVRTVLALIEEHNAGLEQEALLIPFS
jgi:hypothetical protein